MSNTFEFSEVFGLESPFDTGPFPETETGNKDIQDKKPSKKIKSRIVMKFHYPPGKVNIKRPKKDNDLNIYVQKLKDIEVLENAVSKLRHSGLRYDDIEVLNFSLGKNLVKAIELDSKNANIIVDDLMDWMEINDVAHSNDRGMFLRYIRAFVDENPSDFVYEPPNELEKLYELFVLCIELGVIDLSNTAGFLQNEVFLALSNAVRSLKLGEERWNPNIGFKKDGDSYNPLFINVQNISKGISEELEGFLFSNKPLEKNDILIGETALAVEIEDSLITNINQIISWIKEFLIGALNDITELLDKSVKLYNAFVVGFVNGIIELIASIVDAIGLLIGLFNYETLNTLASAIKSFLKEFNWATAKTLLKKELKELFAFIFGDEIYKNAYEFGLFIPKILEIVLDLIGLGKGVLKVGLKLVDIVKKLPKLAKDANRALDDLALQLKLPKIDKKLLQTLKSNGVTIEVKLIPAQQLNSGFPTKFFDGKVVSIKYDGLTLRTFTTEIDANNYLKQLKKDTFLKEEFKRARGVFRKENKAFKKIDSWFEQKRSGFNAKNGRLDFQKMKRLWFNNSSIVKSELKGKSLQELARLKTGNLSNKNIARAKLKIESNGNVLEFDYLEHAGVGSKIDSKGFPVGRNIKEAEFFDPEFNTRRVNDSESKIIELMNEEIAKFSTKFGIPFDDLTIKVKLESTYDPCNVCKRELYLFQQQFKAKIEILRPFYVNENGTKSLVKDNDNFLKLNL